MRYLTSTLAAFMLVGAVTLAQEQAPPQPQPPQTQPQPLADSASAQIDADGLRAAGEDD